MQQFTVPQFIDVEDKVIGPITTRQFIILLVTGFLIFVVYKIFVFTVFAIVGVMLLAFGGILAFARINGQPFHFFMLNILQTWRRPALKVWNKELTDAEIKARMKTPPVPSRIVTPRKAPLTASRLAEISLVVDTGGVYTPE